MTTDPPEARHKAQAMQKVSTVKGRCDAATGRCGVRTTVKPFYSSTSNAAEIRIRAERRLGELLAEQKTTVGLNQGAVKGKTGSKGKPVLDERPTLAAAGIDKKLSSRAQKLAANCSTALNNWDTLSLFRQLSTVATNNRYRLRGAPRCRPGATVNR